MAIPTSPTWRMADQLLEGALAGRLRRYERQGLTPEGIAKRLYADHGVDVSGFTIRNWLATLNGVEAAS